MTPRVSLSAALVIGLALAAAVPAAAQAPAFRIVVHASNGTESLAREDVARLFLKKATAWPDGQPALPVDQTETPARKAFTRSVLERDVSAVRSYWQQMIFSGRAVPPPEKGSDADVLAFVRANTHAIGYVSATGDLGPSVKELRLK